MIVDWTPTTQSPPSLAISAGTMCTNVRIVSFSAFHSIRLDQTSKWTERSVWVVCSTQLGITSYGFPLSPASAPNPLRITCPSTQFFTEQHLINCIKDYEEKLCYSYKIQQRHRIKEYFCHRDLSEYSLADLFQLPHIWQIQYNPQPLLSQSVSRTTAVAGKGHSILGRAWGISGTIRPSQ